MGFVALAAELQGRQQAVGEVRAGIRAVGGSQPVQFLWAEGSTSLCQPGPTWSHREFAASMASLEPWGLSQEMPTAWKGTFGGTQTNAFSMAVTAPTEASLFPGRHRQVRVSPCLGALLPLPTPILGHCSCNHHKRGALLHSHNHLGQRQASFWCSGHWKWMVMLSVCSCWGTAHGGAYSPYSSRDSWRQGLSFIRSSFFRKYWIKSDQAWFVWQWKNKHITLWGTSPLNGCKKHMSRKRNNTSRIFDCIELYSKFSCEAEVWIQRSGNAGVWSCCNDEQFSLPELQNQAVWALKQRRI